ncbi:MAG: hypothetical protein JNL80_17725 [Phycisphaerae bacterium]|nr:hypothetical protein [Phycisphaerae bacterium]
MRALRRLAGIGVVVGCLSGCAVWQTFPPTDGTSFFDPSIQPVPEMMATAIKAALDKSSARDQPIRFNLPEGARDTAWIKVREALGGDATRATEGDRTFVTVEQVRLNGGVGQVDVIVPQGEHYQLFTVHMTGGSLSTWRVTTVQPWTLRVNPPKVNDPVGTGY